MDTLPDSFTPKKHLLYIYPQFHTKIFLNYVCLIYLFLIWISLKLMPTIPVPSPSLPILPSHSYMYVIIPSLWTTYSHTVQVSRRSSGIDKRTVPTCTLGWFPPLVIDWAPCCKSSGTPSSKGQLGPATEGTRAWLNLSFVIQVECLCIHEVCEWLHLMSIDPGILPWQFVSRLTDWSFRPPSVWRFLYHQYHGDRLAHSSECIHLTSPKYYKQQPVN